MKIVDMNKEEQDSVFNSLTDAISKAIGDVMAAKNIECSQSNQAYVVSYLMDLAWGMSSLNGITREEFVKAAEIIAGLHSSDSAKPTPKNFDTN